MFWDHRVSRFHDFWVRMHTFGDVCGFCISYEISPSGRYEKSRNFLAKFGNFCSVLKIMPNSLRNPNIMSANLTGAPDGQKTSGTIFEIFGIFSPRSRISGVSKSNPFTRKSLIWERKSRKSQKLSRTFSDRLGLLSG